MDSSVNKVYEVSFNIVPTLSEEAMAAEFGNLKETLLKLSGFVISEQYPKPISLAYIMEKVIANKNTKFSSAYFGWVKFEAPVSVVEELKRILDRNENIIRHLIIKTVRENTLAPKRTFRPDTARRKFSSQQGTEEVEMDKEAVDKKIEELSVV